MEKAYSLKALLEILKGQGLEIAEESAEILFSSVVEWVKQSATKSESPYDDMILLIMPKIEEIVAKQLDKIDGDAND